MRSFIGLIAVVWIGGLAVLLYQTAVDHSANFHLLFQP